MLRGKSNLASLPALFTPLQLAHSVIAMQILNLVYLGKICPEISSEIVFDEEKWKILYPKIPTNYTQVTM